MGVDIVMGTSWPNAQDNAFAHARVADQRAGRAMSLFRVAIKNGVDESKRSNTFVTDRSAGANDKKA